MNALKTALSRKIEAHKLSRRLKQVRKVNRSGSPWLDAFADALRAGLSEDEALQDVTNQYQKTQKNRHE